MSETPKRKWQEWSIQEWNDALFEFFFRSSDHDSIPVTRLVVNADVLQQVTSDFRTPPKDIRNAFRSLLLDRLRKTGRSLCTDALALNWASRDSLAPPPYFSHLIVSCFAASGASDSLRPKNDFRKRLNRFLGRGDDNARYHLSKLPTLWEMLRDWLDKNVESGSQYRRLLLRPQPASIRLIGYSLDLSFPSHRDQKTLVELFVGSDLPASPPVLSILRTVESGLNLFGDRFRQVFSEFCRAFLEELPDLYQSPFWSSVRDAIATASHCGNHRPHTHHVRLLLRLDREADWKFGLTIYLDQALVGVLPLGLLAIPAEDFTILEFGYVLGSADSSECQTSPPELLLAGALQCKIPQLAAENLFRAVAEGILLFVPDDEDTWTITYSTPRADRVRALVRNDHAETFDDALTRAGAFPNRRSSRYQGWSEVDGFSGHHLRFSDLDSLFPKIVFLQRTIDSPRLHLRGGIRMPHGWLGQLPALPQLVVEPPDVVVTMQPVGANVHEHDVEAIAVPESRGVFSLPSEFAGNLDGSYIIKTRVDGVVRASQSIDFRSNVLSVDYLTLSRPSDWIAEGGFRDVEPLCKEGRSPSDVSKPLEGSIALRQSQQTQPLTFGVQDANREVASLVEILAALSLRRRFIGAFQISDWFTRALKTNGSPPWDVIRAWEEAGVIDGLVYRKWRSRAFVVRRPRLVISFATGSQLVFAVLTGLVTKSVEVAVELAVERAGGKVYRIAPVGPLLPVPITIFLPSLDACEYVSNSTGLAQIEYLLPFEECVVSVGEITQNTTELRKNHQIAGYWDWEEGRFSSRRSHEETQLEWYRREDVPDSFVVRKAGEVLWHTLSRTWAFLVAAKSRGKSAFVSEGTNRLRRSGLGCYLPLSVGRWVTAASGQCPGPVNSGQGPESYEYVFPSAASRELAIDQLWPTPIPDSLVARGRLLGQLVSSRSSSPENMVAVPKWVGLLLGRHSARLGCSRLVNAVYVPARILPQLLSFAQAVRRNSTTNIA